MFRLLTGRTAEAMGLCLFPLEGDGRKGEAAVRGNFKERGREGKSGLQFTKYKYLIPSERTVLY